MFKLTRLLPLFIALLITGCSTVQTTSGSAYLDRHQNVLPRYQAIQNRSSTAVQNSSSTEEENITALIRKAADIEPTLKFPARIGIARIDSGRLTAIPSSEMEAWLKSHENMGKNFGEFVPVSPLITSMAAAAAGYKYPEYSRDVKGLINEIRLGAARQHLDAVLIYEVFSRENSESNVLSVGTLTIIGGYILPSKSVTTEGFANALLIDVLQAYPYGTANATLDKKEMATSFGRSEKMKELSGRVKNEVAIKLVAEVEDMFKDLRLELLQKRLGS